MRKPYDIINSQFLLGSMAFVQKCTQSRIYHAHKLIHLNKKFNQGTILIFIHIAVIEYIQTMSVFKKNQQIKCKGLKFKNENLQLMIMSMSHVISLFCIYNSILGMQIFVKCDELIFHGN